RIDAGIDNYHPDLYTNTPEGYEQNVRDALAVLIEQYNNAVNTSSNLTWTDLSRLYPNNPNESSAARAVLYYNAGFGWWLGGPEYPHSYVNDPLNKPYVGNVANMLQYYVPQAFGFSDPTMVNILNTTQQIINANVP